jgi:HJR/Mrr/RecB family endonuclease
MARQYRRESAEGELFEFAFGISCLYLLLLAVLFYTNKNYFWHLVWYGIAGIVVLFAGALLFVWFRERHRRKKESRIVADVRKAGLGDQIENLIVRFKRGETKNTWDYKDYKIDWDRINVVREDFVQKGVNLTPKDFNVLLRHYIDEARSKVTLVSVLNKTRNFGALSGSEFEGLLRRLYEKMGYTVQLTGRTGDQGGDLVATKGGERLLIQAKRYNDGLQVGNAAVQQAAAAKPYYDCNNAAVVTTSGFTREAIELAKTNAVELVPRSRLQQLLLEHLSESWN